MSYVKLILQEIVFQLRGCQRIFLHKQHSKFYIYDNDHYRLHFKIRVKLPNKKFEGKIII